MRSSLVGVLVAIAALSAVALVIPVEVRHSAPFGFRQTLDRDRGIAVNGIVVTSNYPNFNRVDLDLRAYTDQKAFDLTVVIQPLDEDAEPARVVYLDRSFEQIQVEKGALANPFTTVRFKPIADSEGREYYVWVKLGPRNSDAVVALWSVKSYSRVRGAEVLAAFLRGIPGDASFPTAPVVVGAVMVLFLIGAGTLISVLGREAWLAAWSTPRRRGRPKWPESTC